MGICPSCIRKLVRPTRYPDNTDSLALTFRAFDTDMLELDGDRQSTERYLASTRVSSSDEFAYSPTAEMLAGDYAAYSGRFAYTTGYSSQSFDGSISSFGGFSPHTTDENSRSDALADFKGMDEVARVHDSSKAATIGLASCCNVHVQEFFGRNVPSSVLLDDWELRNEVDPSPMDEEEVMDRVIKRVEIAQMALQETYTHKSGASTVFIPILGSSRRRKGSGTKVYSVCSRSSKNSAPPSHSSIVARIPNYSP